LKFLKYQLHARKTIDLNRPANITQVSNGNIGLLQFTLCRAFGYEIVWFLVMKTEQISKCLNRLLFTIYNLILGVKFCNRTL